MNNQIQEYFTSVCEAYRLGNIETTFNNPIITLLTHFGCNARDLSGERSRQAGENIDIKLWRGGDEITETEPFAGVEVKKVNGIDARARVQIKKEAALFGHAILTDNLVWQFWRAGEDKMYSGVQLMELVDGVLVLNEDNIELFTSLLQDFLLQDPAQIRSSNKLAEYMAIHAKTIRSVIIGILKEDADALPLVDDRQKRLPLFPELYGLFSRIKADLRPLLNTRSFADMYAQTIVYGLFIARYNETHDNKSKAFDRYQAISKLQEESALLNRFFEHITNTGTKHQTLDGVIDKLCALYQMCDISALLSCEKRGDTIVHFYEDFLTYYDPALRKSLGVFYTPHQVVRYLVGMVDKLLVEEFGIQGGLSNNDTMQATVPCERYEYQKTKNAKKEWRDTKELTVPRVAILDPATGTGTFHAEIIKYIKDTYFSGIRAPFYDEYIKNDNGLLSRMIGFEIMMTSYAVAHLNVRRTIEETLGYVPDTQLPTNIFLTNTLAPPNSGFERNEQMSLFDFSAAITDEAYKADTWKARRPIKVIIGNPPYNAASITPYDYSSYRTEIDGKTMLNERNSKVLGDDYVKFIHFAEKLLGKERQGILAFITPHGYYDNPVFRGMRASLLRTFDKIFFLDLHGNSIKNEVAPDGSKDENVFDIRQGVGLIIAVRNDSKNKWADVFHSELWGLRKNKFEKLVNGDIEYKQIEPIDENMAYFVPTSSENRVVYEKGISIGELFSKNTVGIVTGRIGFTVQDSRETMSSVINDLKSMDSEDIREKYSLGKDSSDWKVSLSQDDINDNKGILSQISIFPLDNRWTYYTGVKGLHTRPRHDVMQHLLPNYDDPALPFGLEKNIGITFAKQTTQNHKWDGIFISDRLIERHYIDYPAKGTGYIAPLYLKPEGFATKWHPNINQRLFDTLTANLDKKPTVLEVFDYIYGILFDPFYRTYYSDYLRRDFPRVPIINAPKESDDDFVVSEEQFHVYVNAGQRLRKLHLMQDKVQATIELTPPTATDLEIGAIKYKDGILQLNPSKQITGIPEEVWNYRIGGYQVLDKWFKSHKGKTMDIDDFDHIASVVGLIGETIKVQKDLASLRN